MIDPSRQFGPHEPTAEPPDSAVGERESDRPAPSAQDSGEQLSYDKRAAAAVEAVRQMEAYLSGKSGGIRTPRARPTSEAKYR